MLKYEAVLKRVSHHCIVFLYSKGVCQWCQVVFGLVMGHASLQSILQYDNSILQ